MCINVLFVNNKPFNPILGGIERVTDVLAKSFLAKGYNVYYLCGKVDQTETQSIEYDFPAILYMLPEQGLFSSQINREFYEKLIEDLRIDIVINQRGLNGGFNEMLYIGEVKKISVIHSEPNSEIMHNVSRILLFSKSFREQIKKYIKLALYPLFYLRAIIKAKLMLKDKYRELEDKSDAIVLLSNNDIPTFLSNGIKSSKKMILAIPNPNTFSTSNPPVLDDKENIILFVGRLDPFQKNLLCLLKIWKRLYCKHPQWKLVIVGDGPDYERISEYIDNKRLKNVFLEGAQKDVERYYRKASFICLTSFYEGWGMTLTEGMSYGCIPITFNNYGAASDIIDDGKNGCLINAYDKGEYARRLSELMRDECKRRCYSTAAFDKVKLFAVENVVRRWDNLFHKMSK